MKTIVVAALLASTLTGQAIGAESVGTTFQFGIQSGNPEKDTYASQLLAPRGRQLAFIGPARFVGDFSGNPESDTLAYRPVFLKTIAGAN